MTDAARVLLTNDDGIKAPGLRALAEALAGDGMQVIVAAPLEEASGTSAAMSAYTADGRVIIESRRFDDLPDVTAYAVGASPSYIVVLAMLSTFGDPPDLVLSGINRGANAGRAVLHSGTVGAALTAAAHSCPAMAVSLDVLSTVDVSSIDAATDAASGGNVLAVLDAADDEARNWGVAAGLARDLLKTLADAPEGMVLNVNVPDRPADELRGVRRAGLARFGQVQMALAELGEDFVRTAMEQSRARAEPGTDLALLSDGYATVTPIRAVSEIPDVEIALP